MTKAGDSNTFDEWAPRYSHRRMMQEKDRNMEHALVLAKEAVRVAPSLDADGRIKETSAIINALHAAFPIKEQTSEPPKGSRPARHFEIGYPGEFKR